jgi:signal transduction histidine kinase
MSAHVAHEVRNPLQKIKTGVELLKGSKSLEERQSRILEGVTSGIDTLEKFVTQILDWTRSGKIKPKSYSLSNIIEGLLFNRMEQCDNHAIEIATDFDYKNDTLIIDGVQIRQLLENLIENALDSMTEGGRLTITTARKPDHDFRSQGRTYTADAMEIVVQDTGIGIGRDDIQLIFQPFYTQKARGTGLGLALVQKITDMHHGEIEVESEPGKGSRFVVRVPMDQTAGELAKLEHPKDHA